MTVIWQLNMLHKQVCDEYNYYFKVLKSIFNQIIVVILMIIDVIDALKNLNIKQKQKQL